jgi:hypothetical protein
MSTDRNHPDQILDQAIAEIRAEDWTRPLSSKQPHACGPACPGP